MNAVLSSASTLFRKSKRSLMYGSMAALTIGLEELFECVVFSCPCEGHFAYGMAFLWVPASLLFFPGILLDGNLWKHPRQNTKKKNSYFTTLFDTLGAFTRASIAPAAWLVLSFLQQQYYACAYFGPPLESAAATTNTSDKCHFTLGPRSKQLEESYKTRSQIAGLSLMLIAMLILFISICIQRCIRKGRHLRLPSHEYYRHVAAKEALEQFHTTAKELAKSEAKREIYNLFKSAESKGFDSVINEVGATVEKKYGQFFVIPPESPTYKSPVSSLEDTPRLPSSSRILPELLSNESEDLTFEMSQFASVVGVQVSSQTSSEPDTRRKLARIPLLHDSFDFS